MPRVNFTPKEHQLKLAGLFGTPFDWNVYKQITRSACNQMDHFDGCEPCWNQIYNQASTFAALGFSPAEAAEAIIINYVT